MSVTEKLQMIWGFAWFMVGPWWLVAIKCGALGIGGLLIARYFSRHRERLYHRFSSVLIIGFAIALTMTLWWRVDEIAGLHARSAVCHFEVLGVVVSTAFISWLVGFWRIKGRSLQDAFDAWLIYRCVMHITFGYLIVIMSWTLTDDLGLAWVW